MRSTTASSRSEPPGEDARTALARAMAEPAFYGTDEPVQTRETHGSWVFLVGDRAYKLKKPVRFAFLDYSTRDLRRRACLEELRVNRDLSPDIYLSVRPIVREHGRYRLGPPGSAPSIACDYVVEMRRFDERATLAARTRAGDLSLSEVDAIGRALAALHGDAQRVDDGGADTVAGAWKRCVEELDAFADVLDTSRLRLLARFGSAFTTANADMLDERARCGHIRDVHGDLRADHVVFVDSDVRLVDRLEFDARLRHIDVADDLAFLVADLERRGSPRIAARLVDAYRGAGGAPGSEALVAFYGAYRSLVMTKVAVLRARQHREGTVERERDVERARLALELAERFSWRARLPLAIAFCGPAASGKSTLAQCLSRRSGLTVIATDATRKRLAGVAPHRRASPEHYGVGWNERTYEAVACAAVKEVARAGGVIVDATLRRRDDRARLRDGVRDAPLVFVECQAPTQVLVERAAERLDDVTAISDAGPEIAALQAREFEALTEVPPARHVVLRTTDAPDALVDRLAAWLDETRPTTEAEPEVHPDVGAIASS